MRAAQSRHPYLDEGEIMRVRENGETEIDNRYCKRTCEESETLRREREREREREKRERERERSCVLCTEPYLSSSYLSPQTNLHVPFVYLPFTYGCFAKIRRRKVGYRLHNCVLVCKCADFISF